MVHNDSATLLFPCWGHWHVQTSLRAYSAYFLDSHLLPVMRILRTDAYTVRYSYTPSYAVASERNTSLESICHITRYHITEHCISLLPFLATKSWAAFEDVMHLPGAKVPFRQNSCRRDFARANLPDASSLLIHFGTVLNHPLSKKENRKGVYSEEA